MISRNFRKFVRQGNLKKNKYSNDTPSHFKCNKPGNMKKDCPLLKSKANFNKLNKFKKKKKAFQPTWDDSDPSSSDEEEARVPYI